LAHPLLDLGLRRAAQHQREAQIGGNGHMRIKRVVLEYHGHVALLRRHLVDHALADADLARSDVLKARDHAQQGRLAASRWADQHDEFAVRDQDADPVDHLAGAEGLAHVADRDRSHAFLPLPALFLTSCAPDRSLAGRPARAARRPP